MKPPAFDYVRPEAIDAVIAALAEAPDEVRVMAGGQSLGPILNFRLATPTRVLDMSRIPALREGRIDGEVVRIGCCVTHAMIEDGAVPDPSKGLMPKVAHGIAYRAVRNRGTIGGSVAHSDPAADWLTTLLALNASVVLTSRSGARTLALDAFVLGPLSTAIKTGEVLTEVLVPRLGETARWGHAKVVRKLGDFSDSQAVAVLDPARGYSRLVLGRRSDRPALLRQAGAALLTGGDLGAAVDADLATLSVPPLDLPMHRATALRAAGDARQ